MVEKINNEEPTKLKGISTVTAVAIAIAVSLFVSSLNLFIFLRSDMHDKVKLIQNPSQPYSDSLTLDISSPINAEQIQAIKLEINNRFDILKDDQDYSVYDISESTLGL